MYSGAANYFTKSLAFFPSTSRLKVILALAYRLRADISGDIPRYRDAGGQLYHTLESQPLAHAKPGADFALAHLLGMEVGIAGIIIAVPILAAFKIFCAQIKTIEPVAEFIR